MNPRASAPSGAAGAAAAVPRLLEYLDRWFPPDSRAFMSPEEQTRRETVKAIASMGSYFTELGDTSRLDILDFGCGWGGETLWAAPRVHSVRGVDVDAQAIAQAKSALADSGLTNCEFEWSADGRLPFADRSFDAVLSTDTFEHVMDLDLAFTEIARVLRPGGSLLTRFGPLFYSPHGCHLYWACKVPYVHLLFGLDALAALRAQRGGSRRAIETWGDLGLNGKRFDDYYRSVKGAGFSIDRFNPIPVRRTTLATHVPLVRDLFIFGIDCHVRRAV